MDQRKFPVYIPAGSNPNEDEDPLLQEADVINKALIKLNGKPLIEYILEEVDKSKYTDRIFIVGISQEDIEYKAEHPIDFIPSQGTRMDTLRTLMAYLEEKYQGDLPRHMMIFSADIPLLTSDIIDDVVDNILVEYGESRFDEVEFFYPLVPKEKVLAKYPDANKRFRKFTEGVFATGDFFIFSPHVLKKENTMETTEKIMNSRKTMVRLLFKFDFFAPFKYIFGKLSIRDAIFPFMKDYLDVEMDLIISDHPEICLDLDYPEDLNKMEELVS